MRVCRLPSRLLGAIIAKATAKKRTKIRKRRVHRDKRRYVFFFSFFLFFKGMKNKNVTFFHTFNLMAHAGPVTIFTASDKVT